MTAVYAPDEHHHTGGGKCICPLCGATGWGHYRGWYGTHQTKPHTPCPDCDRSFVSLNGHKRVHAEPPNDKETL